MRNYNKYKKYAKKRKVISPLKISMIMVVLMITMAIGYAALNDTLTINGTSSIGRFTISYNLNGGTNVQNPIVSYDATSNALLPIPTYTNYTFAGWYENDTFTGNAITTTPTRK